MKVASDDIHKVHVKRGLISGLGPIFKEIAGNLDSSDGIYYNLMINFYNWTKSVIRNVKITHNQIFWLDMNKQKISIKNYLEFINNIYSSDDGLIIRNPSILAEIFIENADSKISSISFDKEISKLI